MALGASISALIAGDDSNRQELATLEALDPGAPSVTYPYDIPNGPISFRGVTVCP